MGVFVGNFLGLITVLIAVWVGYPSLLMTTQVFLGITYSLWLLFLGIDLTTRPKTDLPFCRTLEHDEQRTYRRYHVAIDFPVAGHVYSGWMNFLRVAGLVFAGLCAWNGLYVWAGAAFLLFLATAGLIHRNNPWYYLGRQAAQGHARAGAEMALIERVFTQRHAGRQPVEDRELP